VTFLQFWSIPDNEHSYFYIHHMSVVKGK